MASAARTPGRTAPTLLPPLALFGRRPSGRPDSGIDSSALPPLHATPRPLKMKQAPAAFRSAGCKLPRQSRTARSHPQKEDTKGRETSSGPVRFYGRDAPHVAQDKTANLAVRPTSFVSLRSQTVRTHSWWPSARMSETSSSRCDPAFEPAPSPFGVARSDLRSAAEDSES